ncbi:MAG: hypothetical protein V9G14_06680 [Cypionkella sp.]
MSAVTIRQMADRVAELLEERVSAHGADLRARLKKAGRRLPRKVKLAGEKLADGAELAQNPRLYMQLDHADFARSYDVCVRYLTGIKPNERRNGLLMDLAGSIAFAILVVVIGLIAVLYWRGFI